MTADEIQKIAKLVLSADNFCGTCSRNLLDGLRVLHPGFLSEINAVEKNAQKIEDRYRAAVEEWDYGPPETEPRVWDF